MSFWISFSDILYFTRNARKTPLIPEGFVLETPPEHKVSSPVSSVQGPVILIGNNSTDTLVNITVTKPGSPPPILQLHPPANEAVQTRRISFADCPTPSRPVAPVNVIDVGQVPPKPSVATASAAETQAKSLREFVPNLEKRSQRKSWMRRMSLLAPRTSGTKAHRFSVPAFSTVTDVTSKRASNQL